MGACARRSMRRPASKSPRGRSRPKRPTARKCEGMTMNAIVSRRQFLQASAAVGGGLVLEFSFAGPAGAQMMLTDGMPELTHWIVIYPDDRVVIRIARSEMGQGSLTGLAQLVAEELDCDWSKVSYEFVS